MQKRSEKKVSYRRRLARFVAPVGGRTWRALIWQLVLVLLMLFAFAGQDAQAVSIKLWADFGTPPKTDYNIDESFEIQGSCVAADWETRRDMWWELRNEANDIVLDGKGSTSEELNGFGFIKNLNEYEDLKPGKSYQMMIECRTADGPFRGNDFRDSTLNIRALSGKYQGVVDSSNNLLVTGNVGNGANRIMIYLVDKNNKEHYFAEENNLTSGFSISKPLPPGQHKVRVYAEYQSHSQVLGTSLVSSRPVVTLDTLSAFTNNPDIQLSGRASAPDGVQRKTFDGRIGSKPAYKVALNWGDEWPNPVQENGDLIHTASFMSDGILSFQYTVTTSLGTTASSGWQSIQLDRKAPDIAITSPASGSYINTGEKLLVKATDLNLLNQQGSGIESVQMGYSDGKGGYIWLPMQPATAGDYAVDIPFDKLPSGEVKIKVWAQDRAKNETETPVTIYRKALPPAVTMEKPATPTIAPKFNLKGHAHSAAGLENIWISWWKKGDEKKKKTIALNPASGTDADMAHEIDLPVDEKYLFEFSAKALDGQSGVSKQFEVELDATKPIVTIALPKPASILEKEFTLEFRVEDAGTGVRDVQIQLVSGSNVWTKDISSDGAGNYSQKLSLDEVNAGPFELTIWADDQLGNVEWKYVTYTKQVQAADALNATLQFLAADGSVAKGAFYSDQERLLRLSVTPVTTIKNLVIEYPLPVDLAPQKPLSLRNAGGMTTALQNAIKQQLADWRGNGPLLTGIDLPQGQVLELEFPVKIKLPTPGLKIGGMDAPTSFTVSGSNITGSTRAETSWHADWKKPPMDVSKPLVTDFDLSAVSTVSIFDNLSGGYDTAAPERWNRNTLHCADSNAQCEDHADDTSIKLLFKEATSKQSVTLELKGHRELSLISGGTRKTALGAKGNAGADAEARFSVSLSKEALEKFPTEGQWSATLDMELQDFGGARQANFRRDITFNITDTIRRFPAEQALTLAFDMAPPVAGLAIPNPDQADQAGQAGQAGATVSHQVPFVYRIILTAQKQTIKNTSLRYRLPGGLSRTDAPIVSTASNISGGPATASINTQWDGDTDEELLAANTNLKPGESLTLDIPVVVKDMVGNGVSVKSTVNAGAGNLSDALRATHTVKVSERLAGNDRVMVVKSSDAKAQVLPGTRIMYQIRVSNQTSKTVRNLLIRDRAADHTEMVASSCGELPSETCSTFTLNDSDMVEGQTTHDALCTTPAKKSVPGGRNVFWCLNGDLNPLDDYVVDYTLQVNGAAPPP